MHILIAPNAFKNSLTADEAAMAIQDGLSRSRLKATTECFPVGDGGDGTGDLLIRRMAGTRVAAEAHDPLGRKIGAHFGIAGSSTAIIEMATASGLRLLSQTELDPLHASSAGTGDLIRAALDRHAKRILIGMGGSATVDGGTGILQALGARFLDGQGRLLHTLPAQLPELASVDLDGLDPRLAAVQVIVLCDVMNPLSGPEGAAAVFGPQKGATPADVRLLETGLLRLAEAIARRKGEDIDRLPRMGTAGGAAAGLYGFLNARLVSGIEYFLEVTHFEAALGRSDLVITGEGSIDEQTLQGKAPFGVATHAKARGIPVIALTGRLPEDPGPLRLWFDRILPINTPGISLAEALAGAAAHLSTAARALGNILAETR
ncbi:MAG TPA: glycerate kinase [Puia sp.]|nr:glycerate kinase [Puia sp.]